MASTSSLGTRCSRQRRPKLAKTDVGRLCPRVGRRLLDRRDCEGFPDSAPRHAEGTAVALKPCMHLPTLVLIALGCGLVGIGCAAPAASSPAPSRSLPSVRTTVIAAEVAVAEVEAPIAPTTLRAVVYVADGSCAGLERTEVELLEDGPVFAAQRIVQSRALAHLPLDAPEVHVEAGAARVDLKLSTGSTRSLRTLSRCEEIALLRAIVRTLKANPRWGIQRVVFTERGDLLAIAP
jgi:hypothetical protein